MTNERWTAVAAAGAALVAVFVALPLFGVPAGPATPGPDILPLYLGAHAVLHGASPVDPAVLAEQVRALDMLLAPGTAALWSPYPTSASTLLVPLTAFPWLTLRAPLWFVMAASLVGAGLVVGFGGREGASAVASSAAVSGTPSTPASSFAASITAAAAGVVAVCGLDVAPHALALGQVNPLVVVLTVGAAVALARGWDVAAGVLIAVGTGLKYVPAVLLLPALLLWRPRVLVSAALTGLAIGGVTWAQVPHWSPAADLARGVLQSTVGQGPDRAGGWWAWRALPTGAVTLAAIAALTGPRPRPGATGAAVGVTLAFAAAVAGGLSPPHEMLFVAPALAFAAGWLAETGFRATPALCALAAAAAVLTPLDHYPAADLRSQGHAQPLIFLVYALALVRVGWVMREGPAGEPRPA